MSDSETSVAPGSALSPQASGLVYPPGFAGEIADCIYTNSYIQIKEVSIAAALALLAGVCGRAYRTHTSKDLALYIILVARSGVGKDGIHDGIPALISLGGAPGAERIVRQEDFASGPALHKALLTEPGFLNLQGEFGRKLKGMADPSNKPMQDLRTVMTKAFASAFMEGKAYSRAEDCMMGVPFPALSFLGETTPRTYLESLSSDMMEDGFLSRFLTISYDGERPASNPDRLLFMPDDQLKYWGELLAQASQFVTRMNSPAPKTVGFRNADACEKLDRFEEQCRQAINSSVDESIRQMWNRAHLKALKISGVLAAADNMYAPRIDLGHATWAITTVRRDMTVFEQHKTNGDVGSDDHSRLQKLVALTRDYFQNPVPASYKVNPAMRENGIIPRMYLQKRITGVAVFESQRVGSNMLLDQTLRSMIDNGYLMDVQKDKMVEGYSFHGKCYRLLRFP